MTYEWRDPASQGDMTGRYTGLIAQEVEPVFPEWIDEGPDGFKRLTVIEFEGIVVEALRELRTETDNQIASLRAENNELRERLEALESALGSIAVSRDQLDLADASDEGRS